MIAFAQPQRAANLAVKYLVHLRFIDEDAVAFYRKFGFEPSPLDPKQLMLLMKDLRATLQSLGLG
jgi:hypothetical protein